MIAQTGEMGVPQNQLSKDTGIEANYLHHHLKTLAKFNLIYKKQVVITNPNKPSILTNNIYLKRYKPPELVVPTRIL